MVQENGDSFIIDFESCGITILRMFVDSDSIWVTSSIGLLYRMDQFVFQSIVGVAIKKSCSELSEEKRRGILNLVYQMINSKKFESLTFDWVVEELEKLL